MNQMKNDPDHEYHDEATRVLSFVNKRQGGTGAKGLRKYLNKELENAGYGENAVQSIYGKGGYVKGTLNYSVVINDKYVLSLYSKMPGQSASAMRPSLNKIAFNTITKNLKPDQLGVGSPERQKQDTEVEDWNRREMDRTGLKADWDTAAPEIMDAAEIDVYAPEEVDKELDMKTSGQEENLYENLIKEEFKKLLQERGSSIPLVRVEMSIKFEKDFSFYGNQSNVLNQIRSIKGITVAKASDVGVMSLGASHKMVLLHLKFLPDRPMHQYLTYLQMELKKIKDQNGDRIIATRIKGIPRKV